MNGKLFAKFVKDKRNIWESCKPAGNIFVQHRVPSQNCKSATVQLEKLGEEQLSSSESVSNSNTEHTCRQLNYPVQTIDTNFDTEKDL